MYDRKAWLSLMATCDKERISSLWQDSQINVDFGLIRDAEVGAVMVKARQGCTGDAFHFSEMSLTRCSVRLASGEIGHGYHQGRSKQAAKIVALCDALAQTEAYSEIEKKIFNPLNEARQKRRETLRKKAAATKVDFFTLVRGEDK